MSKTNDMILNNIQHYGIFIPRKLTGRVVFEKKKKILTYTLIGVYVFEKTDVAVVAQRTLFARVSPSLSYGGATQLFSAHDTLELSLAHVVYYSRVTRTDPVVWNAKRRSDVNNFISIKRTAADSSSRGVKYTPVRIMFIQFFFFSQKQSIYCVRGGGANF